MVNHSEYKNKDNKFRMRVFNNTAGILNVTCGFFDSDKILLF